MSFNEEVIECNIDTDCQADIGFPGAVFSDTEHEDTAENAGSVDQFRKERVVEKEPGLHKNIYLDERGEVIDIDGMVKSGIIKKKTGQAASGIHSRIGGGVQVC